MPRCRKSGLAYSVLIQFIIQELRILLARKPKGKNIIVNTPSRTRHCRQIEWWPFGFRPPRIFCLTFFGPLVAFQINKSLLTKVSHYGRGSKGACTNMRLVSYNAAEQKTEGKVSKRDRELHSSLFPYNTKWYDTFVRYEKIKRV